MLKLQFLVSVLPKADFASRADISRVTPYPHHGVTHGSNVLVDKSHSQTPDKGSICGPREYEFRSLPTVLVFNFVIQCHYKGYYLSL